MTLAAPNVAEIQGLYGPYSFPEKLLQKIWLRGEFDCTAAFVSDGRKLSVLFPGKWNLLGGPDFLGARLRFDNGREVVGDVELHLHAVDWAAHGHARDPAYSRVILHVVLFPLKPGDVTRDAAGAPIPVLVLLPLLRHDLEAFAADEAVETLAQRPAARIVEELGKVPRDELEVLLKTNASERWRLKVHFARRRVDRLGWGAACHHAALEILGFRFNRSPMLRIAARFPLELWVAGKTDAAEVWESERPAWSLQGVRPANHPRIRLEQYGRWTRAVPDWPHRLKDLLSSWPEVRVNDVTRNIRRSVRLGDRRAHVARQVLGGVLSGTRLDSIVCDGLLPLLAAGDETEQRWAGWWHHWPAGDLPPVLAKALRELAVFSAQQPGCNGLGQGLLGWILKREVAALVPLGRGA